MWNVRRWVGGLTTGFFVAMAVASGQAATAPDALKSAADTSAKVAASRGFQSLLVVVRADPDSTGDLEVESVLGQIASQIESSLKTARVGVSIYDGDIESTGRSLTPGEVSDLPEADKYDGVLNVDYRRRAKVRYIRVALLTPREKVWSKTVSLSQGPLTVVREAQADSTELNATQTSRNPKTSLLAAGQKLAQAREAESNVRAATTGPTGFFQGFGTGDESRRGRGRERGRGVQAQGERRCRGTPGEETEGDEVPSLNQRVLQFALDHLGQQVGNGECWTLADEALKAAGAKPAEGYTFGTEIEMTELMPGDILQFTSARFETPNTWIILGAPNHTAIVQAVKGDVVHILHQNFGTRTVTKLTLDFSTMVAGEVQAYRPESKDQDQDDEVGEEKGGGKGKGKGKCKKPDERGGETDDAEVGEDGTEDSGNSDSPIEALSRSRIPSPLRP